MELLRWLQSMTLDTSISHSHIGVLTFAGILFAILGVYYLSGAVHEYRVGRIPQLLSTVLLSGLGYWVAFFVGLHRSVTESLVGLALGLGLGLGLNAWFPIQFLFHSVLGIILNVGRVITLGLATVVFGLLFSIANLPGFLLAMTLWGVIWLVTIPIFAIVRKVTRKSGSLDGTIIKLFGDPTKRSAPMFLLSPVLPKSPTARWLVYGIIAVSVYAFNVIIGAVIATGGGRFLAPALQESQGLTLSILEALGFGIACGYLLFAPAVMLQYQNATHEEDGALVRSIESDVGSDIESISKSVDEGDLAGTASGLGTIGRKGTQSIADDVLDRDVPTGGFSEEQKRAGARLARVVISSAGSFNVGLTNALILGVTVSLLAVGTYFAQAPILIVLGLLFLAGASISTFNRAGTLIASTLLVVLGIVLQYAQYLRLV